MSKSKGNVIYADDLVDLFGVDAIRFYLLNEIPFANDGTITYDLVIDRVNSELANTLGNLVQRTISMGNKYFEGHVTNKNVTGDFDEDLKSVIAHVPELVKKNIDSIHLIDALDAIFDLFRRCNKYIDETTPWVLAKEEDKKDRLETVIYNLLEGIRVGAEILSPFLPETSDKIFSQLNIDNHSEEYVSDNEYNVGTPSPLFMRLEKDER